ncbi:MAG TPA: hypothetical protein VLA19_21310 [Herpetosiphonaceae bacterium]|nr:hypothetical protein [Herpetosiphonaceae bacterium]
MSTKQGVEDSLFFQQSWQHLMGALDAVLEDARGNAASLGEAHGSIDALLARAEQEREAASAALHELVARREVMAETLNEMQRQLAVAGVPLRGEIS